LEVIVDDTQLSLAIGKKGQNVRLAAKLLGWKIDIKSEEEKRQEVEQQMQALTGGPATPIEQVTELGESIIQKLVAAGITTVEGLADMTPEELEEIPASARRLSRRSASPSATTSAILKRARKATFLMAPPPKPKRARRLPSSTLKPKPRKTRPSPSKRPQAKRAKLKPPTRRPLKPMRKQKLKTPPTSSEKWKTTRRMRQKPSRFPRWKKRSRTFPMQTKLRNWNQARLSKSRRTKRTARNMRVLAGQSLHRIQKTANAMR